MCAEDILLSLLYLPVTFVPETQQDVVASVFQKEARCRGGYLSLRSRLTLVNHSLPLSGPSSLSAGSLVGTRGLVQGLKHDVLSD